MTRVDKLIALAADQAGTPEGQLAAMVAIKQKLTKEQVLLLKPTRWWEHPDRKAVGEACLHQELMVCPRDVYWECVEAYMGRKVSTIEYSRPDVLLAEAAPWGKTLSECSAVSAEVERLGLKGERIVVLFT